MQLLQFVFSLLNNSATSLVMFCINKTLLFLLTYKHIIEHKTRDVFVRNTLSPYCAALIHVFFTFDLEGWPWPFTTQNVQLHEIHMHAKYQVAMWRDIEVMSIFQKLNGKSKRKVWRKDRQTDRQTDGPITICPHLGA